ncbi:unnamed protein product, partial [Symbiodinium sp. KB8]
MGILKAKVEDRELVLCGSANRPLRALFECLPPEAATPHIAFSALVLQSQGLLSHGALRPLRRPLSEALESGGCAPAVRSVDPESALEAYHEPGYRGRELPKEAHTIAKVLARLGGPHVPLPLRRPWIVRPAGLSVHLLLPPRWAPDDGE